MVTVWYNNLGSLSRRVCVCLISFRVVTEEMKALSSHVLRYFIPPHICFPPFILNDNGINTYNGKQKSDLKCFPKTFCPKGSALSLSIRCSVSPELTAESFRQRCTTGEEKTEAEAKGCKLFRDVTQSLRGPR